MDDMKSVKSPLEQAGFSPSVEAADSPHNGVLWNFYAVRDILG